MNRLGAQLYRVNCIFLLGFDSQLLTHCAITGCEDVLFFFLSVFFGVVCCDERREATVKCVASLQKCV